MRYLFLISSLNSLSYNCNLGEISKTHFLYKEDNVREVKWLEKIDYCKAKGLTTVYRDAGQGKCEYSRGLCYWDGKNCLNTYRDFDNFDECVNLLLNNILVDGLDNGRLQNPQPVFEPVVEPKFESPIEEPQSNVSTTTVVNKPKPKSTQMVSSDIIFYTSFINYIYIFII